MRNFQKKRGWKNIMQSRPVLVLLGILVFIFASSVIGFMGKMQMTIENRKIAENKVAELEKTKKELSTETANLRTENGIEESIRDKFPVAKAGEGVIVILEDKNSPEASQKESGGFFSFFKNLFK